MKLGAAAFLLASWLACSSAAAAGDDLSDLAFRPNPGGQLPLATRLVDERGRTVSLANFFAGKPVVLVLEYLRCRSLCGLTLQRLVATLDELPLDAGRDFQAVAISIDPRDTPDDAAAAKAKYLADYHHPGAPSGLHFLTGSAEAVRAIADAVGFPYRWDADAGQYIHPVGFTLAAGDGRISRYYLGFGTGARELQSGLADAAAGRAVGPLTRLLLLCHLEGEATGRYSAPIEAAFTLANLAAIAALLAIFLAIRRRRHG